MINQVFSNLIDNALKYQRAEEPLRIRISGHIDKNEVIYSVQDNGIGIAPEHYDKIFEIFHRLNPDGPQKGEGQPVPGDFPTPPAGQDRP